VTILAPRTRSHEAYRDDFHFVREKVALGVLDVRFISTADQLADVFTKPATQLTLRCFSSNLNLVHDGLDLGGVLELYSCIYVYGILYRCNLVVQVGCNLVVQV
jgi:hypothetical protein